MIEGSKMPDPNTTLFVVKDATGEIFGDCETAYHAIDTVAEWNAPPVGRHGVVPFYADTREGSPEARALLAAMPFLLVEEEACRKDGDLEQAGNAAMARRHLAKRVHKLAGDTIVYRDAPMLTK